MAKVKIFLELWHGEEGEKEKNGADTVRRNVTPGAMKRFDA